MADEKEELLARLHSLVDKLDDEKCHALYETIRKTEEGSDNTDNLWAGILLFMMLYDWPKGGKCQNGSADTESRL